MTPQGKMYAHKAAAIAMGMTMPITTGRHRCHQVSLRG
jgi:hypothetical protein